MKTKKSHEGYLLVDHRNSPGVTPDFIRQSGKDAPFAHAGSVLESATYTCSHCNAIVVMNPGRRRARGYCPNCDHYICDACESQRLIAGCRPMNKILDELHNKAARGE